MAGTTPPLVVPKRATRRWRRGVGVHSTALRSEYKPVNASTVMGPRKLVPPGPELHGSWLMVVHDVTSLVTAAGETT